MVFFYYESDYFIISLLNKLVNYGPGDKLQYRYFCYVSEHQSLYLGGCYICYRGTTTRIMTSVVTIIIQAAGDIRCIAPVIQLSHLTLTHFCTPPINQVLCGWKTDFGFQWNFPKL